MRTKKNRIISEKMLADYRKTLIEEEKSGNTVKQYMNVLEDFMQFSDGKAADKGMAVRYKEILVKTYKPRSVNAKLSALNSFFKSQGWYECIVKLVKIQNETFRPNNKVLTKDEYRKLLDAASDQGRERLNLALQTLCSMGLRVSELKFVTVEAVQAGFAEVTLKGKSRTVLLPEDLKVLLGGYIKEQNIKEGYVFVTRTGKPLDRSNIWRQMKSLNEKAGIERSKIFPHNLRHLFACVYYAGEKNANHLADIMGHSSLDTTRIYTQVSMEEELEALNRMGLVNIVKPDEKICTEEYEKKKIV
ncbi:MAG: tyrosine-type recombinase/integrase [Clostridiales bacterium]|nr:tyrosine-type recombinase/integrase [Clostridiales bacterium]